MLAKPLPNLVQREKKTTGKAGGLEDVNRSKRLKTMSRLKPAYRSIQTPHHPRIRFVAKQCVVISTAGKNLIRSLHWRNGSQKA
jgi:hypothetical protein